MNPRMELISEARTEDVGERLPIAVADDEAGVGFLDGVVRRLALKAPHH